MQILLDSFVFGTMNSLHCAGMCGPLALAFQGGSRGAFGYHLARLLSYTALGVGLGALGSTFGTAGLTAPAAYVAFVLAAGMIVLALAGERGAIAIPGLGNLAQRAIARTRGWSPTSRASALGACTPLLPCGLLWSASAGAAIAGNGLDGGTVMAGFALGTLPVLLFAQTQAGRLAERFGPDTLRRVQRTAMLLAAALLVWRGVATLQGGSCCH